MAPAATVLVPTHNHGPLLRPAVESALAQTVADIEIFIVGDGATEDTAETARTLEREDGRIRFFENPKGEHHGEVHRHAALMEASAPVVCYLSDDDLWFPEHVAYLMTLLEDNDFAHSLPVFVRPDGRIGIYAGNLADPWWRRYVLEKGNFIPLHSAGHTMDLYRRLPHGWRPSSPEVWSDLYMWRQILHMPGCRAVSGTVPTSLHLTSARRRDMSPGDRLSELRRWSGRVQDPDSRAEIRNQIFEALAERLAHHAGRDARLSVREASLQKQLEESMERDADEITKWRSRAEKAEIRLAVVRGTRTWRLRNRLLALPVVGRLMRMAGRARSGRAAR